MQVKFIADPDKWTVAIEFPGQAPETLSMPPSSGLAINSSTYELWDYAQRTLEVRGWTVGLQAADHANPHACYRQLARVQG